MPHAHLFGLDAWAWTNLLVCGLLAGVFNTRVRLREEKNTTNREYGNGCCVISWLCDISVMYGPYEVAGVGAVESSSVVSEVPVSYFIFSSTAFSISVLTPNFASNTTSYQFWVLCFAQQSSPCWKVKRLTAARSIIKFHLSPQREV